MFKKRFLVVIFLCSVFLCFSSNLLASLVIAEGKATGQWYNPSRDGEGFYVEVIQSGDSALIGIAMYSYDNSGEQLWIVGTAPVSDTATTATIPVFRVEGPVWGTGYDPDDRVTTDFGTLTVRFTGCNSALFQLRVDAEGFEDGDYTLVRLTNVVGIDCVDSPPKPPEGEGVESGEWGESTTSCMYVAPDGRSLTPTGSSCPEGASVWLNIPGIFINTEGFPNIEPCVANIWCTDDVNITSEGSFQCTTPNSGIIEGYFISKTDMYGYGYQAQGENVGGVCIAEWNSEPR